MDGCARKDGSISTISNVIFITDMTTGTWSGTLRDGMVQWGGEAEEGLLHRACTWRF
jgi:hypothetical protein